MLQEQMACWLGYLPALPLCIVIETASARCSSSGELDRESIHVVGHRSDSPTDQPVFLTTPLLRSQVLPRCGLPQRNSVWLKAYITQLTEQHGGIIFLPGPSTWSIFKEVDHCHIWMIALHMSLQHLAQMLPDGCRAVLFDVRWSNITTHTFC